MNVATVAQQQRGVPTVPEFFTEALARKLASDGYAADVIHAKNVLAHVPDTIYHAHLRYFPHFTPIPISPPSAGDSSSRTFTNSPIRGGTIRMSVGFGDTREIPDFL